MVGADWIVAIRARLLERQLHFLKPHMLASQCAELEEPIGALVIEGEVVPSGAVVQLSIPYL